MLSVSCRGDFFPSMHEMIVKSIQIWQFTLLPKSGLDLCYSKDIMLAYIKILL